MRTDFLMRAWRLGIAKEYPLVGEPFVGMLRWTIPEVAKAYFCGSDPT